MDERDRQLIDLLRTNAREPLASLARKMGVARATVQERLRRLEAAGTIAGYTVQLGGAAAARKITAHVLLKVDAKKSAHLVGALKKILGVRSLHAVSGTYDYTAIIEADTTDEVDKLLDKIGMMEGVRETLSFIVLSARFQR